MFDEEFNSASEDFFQEARRGRFRIVVSRLVELEIETAPKRVYDFFLSWVDSIERNPVVESAVKLQQAFLENGVVGEGSRTDALHVALASTLDCRLIVSWNCRHIVHFKKIPMYNEIIERHGAPIGIHTPMEVIHYEDENF